jgi:hypothetical protein
MITYGTVISAFVVTLIGLMVHIIWWRIKRPKDDVRALVLCLVVLPVLIVLGIYAYRTQGTARDILFWNIVTTAVLAVILGSTYILSYPGAQAGSPSMLILLNLAAREPNGMTREELMNGFDDAMLCNETIASVVHERFAERHEGKLVPATRGVSMLRVCQAWRAVLGLKDGEG